MMFKKMVCIKKNIKLKEGTLWCATNICCIKSKIEIN